MTPREMQYAFEEEAARFDSELILESHIIYHWLDEAQTRFFKTRYSGVNSKREGFEGSQKRVDDLRTLVKEVVLSTTTGDTSTGDKPNSYLVDLPTDYTLTVGEEANITFTDYNSNDIDIRVEVYPITSDEYTKEVNSVYGKHKLHYETATPLSLLKDSGVELISDGDYEIPYYYLRYLKKPNEITVNSADCELPEHTHSEIVVDAVKLLLENLGDPRYQSNKGESLEQE